MHELFFITMTISELQSVYAAHPNTKGLATIIKDGGIKTVYVDGVHASCMPLFFSAFIKENPSVYVFVLNDNEEAGYFYHDMVQANGDADILFFPSSYRRAIKYGQKDAANEILRTEVLSRLEKRDNVAVVTYPEALAEKVVSKKLLTDKTVSLKVGQNIETDTIATQLVSLGFDHVDYVYEPGQFATRGSILDVFSFASEFPYRIDFFGDEIDSIRTFEVESQLSKEKKSAVNIVPELTGVSGDSVTFLDFLPSQALLCVKDLLWVRERIQSIHDEVLSSQAIAAAEDGDNVELPDIQKTIIQGTDFTDKALDFRRIDFGSKPIGTPQARLKFETSVQPIFHKNFDMVSSSLNDFIQRGYKIYICSDSSKQTDRLKDIFKERGDNIVFEPVDRTLHEGFVDHTMRLCIFTDHQIFDRFHKYNLRSDKARSGKVALSLKELSDKARSGKVALSLKELNQFEPGDYVVHIDHGIGRFAGLVRIPNGNTTQEVIKLIYQNDDVVFVSIHSLHKISKYKGKEGEPPRISKLGTGAWEKIKERTKTKIKDIARDLIKLYSQRKQEKGFKYSPDSFLQHELEASFLYEDTPDQSKATQEVKADMESDRPMDRLVCGDVGFGKTEVAVRAAFRLWPTISRWRYLFLQQSLHTSISRLSRNDLRDCHAKWNI